MQIRTSVYESLTPLQRISATLKALDRNDEKEVRRLTETCPLKTYRQRDAEFSDRMEALLTLSMAVEFDLTAYALSYFSPDASEENKRSILQSMANLHGGWVAMIVDIADSAQSILKIGPPRHRQVDALLQISPPCQISETATIREEFKYYVLS
jgi:hypothetical protein